MAVLLIFGVFMGYSISYADNVENVVVEESEPPVTDKSIERTYEAKKGMYKYALSKNTVFTSNVPNGIITNDDVYIDISDKVSYTFTKDGKKYSYSRGEPITEDGIYSLSVTVDNSSELKFDFSSLNFSLDSLENDNSVDSDNVVDGVGTDVQQETPAVADAGVVVTDESWGLANGTVFEFKFRIINKACNNISIFNLPEKYAFESITFDENDVNFEKKEDHFLLKDNGKYIFKMYDKENPKKKFTTVIIRDKGLPMLKLEGVVNGLTTYEPVVVKAYENGITYTATCDGETVRPYSGAFSEAGLYTIKAKDEAGNTNEYTFRILYTMNLSSGTVIGIVLALIIFIVGYVVYLKKHMRVY